MSNEQFLSLADASYEPGFSGVVDECDQARAAEHGLTASGEIDLFGDAFTAIGDAEWMDDALCAQTDAESFFPESGGSSLAAKKTCEQCLVRAECLGWALTNDERFGVWGGLTDQERQAIKLSPAPHLQAARKGQRHEEQHHAEARPAEKAGV